MNSDQMAGKWKQMKGSVKQQWGKLTDDDIEYINGKQDSLVGKLQERYGIAKEEAQKRADEFMKTYSQTETQSRPVAGSTAGQHEQHQPKQHQPEHAGKR